MATRNQKNNAIKATVEIIKAHGNNPNFGNFTHLPQSIGDIYNKLKELYEDIDKES